GERGVHHLRIEPEAPDLEVAHIPGKALGVLEAVVHLPPELELLTTLLLRRIRPRGLVRYASTPVDHPQVPVMAHPLEMSGQRIGQGVGADDATVLPPPGTLAHRPRHLPCLGREDVALLDPLQDSLDDPISGGGIDGGVRPAVELLGLERGCEDERERGCGEGWAHSELRGRADLERHGEGQGAANKTLKPGSRLRGWKGKRRERRSRRKWDEQRPVISSARKA